MQKFHSGKEAVHSLPASLRIGPYDWKVIPWTALGAGSERSYGQCCSLQLEIRVAEEIASPQKAMNTTIHEINHALYFAYRADDEDMEERVVETFATAWTQIYRDNPALLTWFQRCC